MARPDKAATVESMEQQFSGSTFHSSSSWWATVIIRRFSP